MALDAVHPQYEAHRRIWAMMRDFYKGEEHVKSKLEEYLPATSGMHNDGMKKTNDPGMKAYQAYVSRAVFPDYVKDAVETYIGLLHQKPPTIELPASMEPLRMNATMHGENLELLLRRINEQQLVTGRVGLLLDLPVNPDPANPMPYIALYVGEAVRNWDDGEVEEGRAKLRFVVLDESSPRLNRAVFTWEQVTKYRVLMLDETGVYKQGAFACRRSLRAI